jgi:hypothetical protein
MNGIADRSDNNEPDEYFYEAIIRNQPIIPIFLGHICLQEKTG